MSFEIGDKVFTAREMKFGAYNPLKNQVIPQGTQGEVVGLAEIDTDGTPLSYLVMIGEYIYTIQWDALYRQPDVTPEAPSLQDLNTLTPPWLTGQMLLEIARNMPGDETKASMDFYESIQLMTANNPIRKVILFLWGLGA